jgi:hypothetical protein
MTVRRWRAQTRPCRPNGSGRGVINRKKLKSLWKLIAAREDEPSLLHIQEVLPEPGVGLEAGPICALLRVQTALSRFPTHAYKQGDLPGRPDIPMVYNLALTLGWVNQKKCNVALG